jgi:hypothetical protein
MIQQKLSRYYSLVGTVNDLRMGKFDNVEDILGKIHLLGDWRIGWEALNENEYINPNELGHRFELLMDFCKLPATREEFKACSKEAKEVRGKCLQSIFSLVNTMAEIPGLNLLNFMSFEVFERLCIFYGQVENIPVHEKQAQAVFNFFQKIYYLDSERNSVPYWFVKGPGISKIREVMLNALIATSIAYSLQHGGLPQLICGSLPELDLVDFLKRVDYYARGEFRHMHPEDRFDGHCYNHGETYEMIIGLESIKIHGYKTTSLQRIVLNAALLAAVVYARIK